MCYGSPNRNATYVVGEAQWPRTKRKSLEVRMPTHVTYYIYKVRKRSYEAINVRKQLKYKTDSEDAGSDNDSLVEGDVSSDY